MNLSRSSRRLGRDRRRFRVPLDSMSDVAFLLLIFIMLVSLINYRREVPIAYAEAETARKTSVEKNLEIWVDGAGKIYLDGLPCAPEALEDGIIAAYRSAPETRVHIIADRDVPFENVQAVLDILQRLQYGLVSLVVKDAQP